MSDPRDPSTIDWESLHGAYGDAGSVPDTLAALATTSGDDWGAAFNRLTDVINHQGDTYDSSVAAIPFLMQLAVECRGEHRRRLLHLVRSLGIGNRYHFVMSAFWFVDEANAARPSGEPPEERLKAPARQATRADWRLIERLFDDTDPASIAVAASVLELSEAARDRVRRLAVDRLAVTADGDARAALLYLELTSATAPERPALAAQRLETEPTPQGRVIARLAIHNHPVSPWAPDEVDALVDDLCSFDPGQVPLAARLSPRALCASMGSDLRAQIQLCAALLQQSPSHRRAALKTITELDGQWRDIGVALEDAVTGLLNDEDEEVRFRAARTLDAVAATTPVVRSALPAAFYDDPSTTVRLAAGLALGPALSDRDLTRLFRMAAVAQPASDERLPVLVYELVVLIGPRGLDQLPVLLGAVAQAIEFRQAPRTGSTPMYDRARFLRYAVEAIGRLGPAAAEAVPVLERAIAAGVSTTPLLEALGQLGEPALAALATIRGHCPQYEVDLLLATVAGAPLDTEAIRAEVQANPRLAGRLGRFGRRAQPLGPDLDTYLNRRLARVTRIEVAAAVLEIGHASRTAEQVVVELLRDFPIRDRGIDWPRALRALVAARRDLKSRHALLATIATSRGRVLENTAQDRQLREIARAALDG